MIPTARIPRRTATLITDDGGWLVPETAAGKPSGDLNADGKFDDADAKLLLKWLLAEPDTELPDWKAGDMNSDGFLKAIDLSLMKQKLLTL